MASICGGAGSGMALDAGYAVRQLLQELGREPSLEETFLAEYGKGTVEAATR